MRQFMRHPSEMPLNFSVTGKNYAPDMKDISEGGLCFVSPKPLSCGTRIFIQIPVLQEHFEAEAVVVWCQAVEKLYDVGVNFADTATEFAARMVEQLCQIEIYRKKVAKEEKRFLTSEMAAKEWISRYADNFP